MIPSGKHCTIPRSIHSRVHNRRTHSRIHDRISRIVLGLMHEGIRNRFIAGLTEGQRNSHQESERFSVGFAAGVRAAFIERCTQGIRYGFKDIFTSGSPQDSQQSSQRYSQQSSRQNSQQNPEQGAQQDSQNSLQQHSQKDLQQAIHRGAYSRIKRTMHSRCTAAVKRRCTAGLTDGFTT